MSQPGLELQELNHERPLRLAECPPEVCARRRDGVGLRDAAGQLQPIRAGPGRATEARRRRNIPDSDRPPRRRAAQATGFRPGPAQIRPSGPALPRRSLALQLRLGSCRMGNVQGPGSTRVWPRLLCSALTSA